jgi:hypothetical protein
VCFLRRANVDPTDTTDDDFDAIRSHGRGCRQRSVIREGYCARNGMFESRRRTSFTHKIVALTSGTVVVGCAALAVPAFGFVSRSTHTVVVSALKNGTSTATCPNGEHVSFGGVIGEFKPPPNTTGHPAVYATSMHRTAANRWTVTGQSETVGTGSHLSAVAYCDPGTVPRRASNTVRLPGNNAKTAIANCPAGTVVVGGGYSSGSSFDKVEYLGQLDLNSSTQLAVTMVNLVKTATTVTAIAYCAVAVAPAAYTTTLTIVGHKGGTARVRCPAGASVVFGGVLVSPPSRSSHTNYSAVVPFSWTAPSTTQWVVTGYNLGTNSGTLTAVAYCR